MRDLRDFSSMTRNDKYLLIFNFLKLFRVSIFEFSILYYYYEHPRSFFSQTLCRLFAFRLLSLFKLSKVYHPKTPYLSDLLPTCHRRCYTSALYSQIRTGRTLESRQLPRPDPLADSQIQIPICPRSCHHPRRFIT